MPTGPYIPGDSRVVDSSASLCEQLDAGAVPAQALPTLPGISEDPEGVLADAAETIREDCPQHARAAESIQDLVDSGAAAGVARDPGDAALQACVEQTGQTEEQCREQAAGGGAN